MKKIVLRKEPLLEFSFLINGFQFTDDSEDNTSSFFEYHKISKLETREKSTNWWLTIINFTLEILFQVGDTEINEDKRQIRFKYKGQLIVLLLNNCDFKTILEIKEFLSKKLQNA